MHQLDLSPVIRSQNTLVISCVECDILRPTQEGVYVFSCLAATLREQDPTLEENIRYFIEEKACTQVIIAGHLHCNALQHIRLSNSQDIIVSSIKSYLDDLESKSRVRFTNTTLQEKFLTELNIIRQTKLLMQFGFIQDKMDSGDLSITGVIYDEKSDSIETIFFNGLIVNTLIAMN